jgi:hypothetical protein
MLSSAQCEEMEAIVHRSMAENPQMRSQIERPKARQWRLSARVRVRVRVRVTAVDTRRSNGD